MDDFQAIQQLKKGNVGGLEFLISRYQDKAVRTAFLITHNEPMAEDVVQDAFVHFYERIHLFDETRPFEPYFLCSVVHSALNVSKRDQRLKELPDELDSEEVELLFAQAISVEGQIEYSQMKQEILNLLGKLPPKQRAVIVQRYYLEMSEKEMSEALSVAPGTIKWLLNIARTRLRLILGTERTEE